MSGGPHPRSLRDIDAQQLSLHRFLWGTFVPLIQRPLLSTDLFHAPSSRRMVSFPRETSAPVPWAFSEVHIEPSAPYYF